ncbi:hypothetical protein [Bacillus suaedaesalsae]|uniref:Uncharacterized protein n=1 Tax=Bacillus suaedaesalsae TaxID=2810349 RepID=A0ABS2DFN6_9BACI|nr:hypothetical protein [Bacillus suaedaesalsae]MBM6617283.1 hypothetical protein [Bacillus suaedaesalsae]
MKKVIIIIVGIIVVGTLSFSILTNPFEAKKANDSKIGKDLSLLESLTDRLDDKYEGVFVKTTHKNELVIQINGNADYINTVKNDIKTTTTRIINSSSIKDYNIVVEGIDLSSQNSEEINKELSLLTSTLMEGLKEYEGVGDIHTEYPQKTISIQTSIKDSGKKQLRQLRWL